MDTREYLQQVKTLTVKIEQRQCEVNELREAVMSVRSPAPDKERVQSSGTNDTLSETVAKYIDMVTDIEDMFCDLSCLKHKIIGEIHEINDPRYIEVLYKRYVELKKWELIALEMDYDYDYVRALDVKAVKLFGETILSAHTNTQTDEL